MIFTKTHGMTRHGCFQEDMNNWIQYLSLTTGQRAETTDEGRAATMPSGAAPKQKKGFFSRKK